MNDSSWEKTSNTMSWGSTHDRAVTIFCFWKNVFVHYVQCNTSVVLPRNHCAWAACPCNCSPVLFPLGLGECWAVCMLIVVLLQYFIPRLPAGRVRDCTKCVICLSSYLSGCWTYSSQMVSSTDDDNDLEMVVTYCDVSFFPACSLLSLKSNTKR